jgi:hypothetical protein
MIFPNAKIKTFSFKPKTKKIVVHIQGGKLKNAVPIKVRPFK